MFLSDEELDTLDTESWSPADIADDEWEAFSEWSLYHRPLEADFDDQED